MNHENKDIPLDFIREKLLLTERSLNNCARAGLNSLLEILNHYTNHKTFIGNGCGEKSNIEMINFCNYYIDNPQKSNDLYKEYKDTLTKPKIETKLKPAPDRITGIYKFNKLKPKPVIKDKKDLIKLIKSRREKMGLTQAALAKLIGCSDMTINLFEHRGRKISIDKIFAICKELGIVICWDEGKVRNKGI